MTNEIKNLIFSITKLLQNYSNGTLLFDEAKNEYQKLLDTYQKINKYEKSDKPSSLLNGFCYYHNINNFSIFSGIFRIHSNNITSIVSYGDNKLKQKISNSIQNNLNLIKTDKISKISSDVNSELTHTIYIFPIEFYKNNITIFISLSSSSFFSYDKFSYQGKIMKELFYFLSKDFHPPNLNFFDKTVNETKKYLLQNIDDEYYIKVNLYVFKKMSKIFSNMGIDSLIEACNKIIETLKINFRDSIFFTISPEEYLVLIRLKRNEGKDDKAKKIDFIYKDITIPYTTAMFNFEDKESIYILLEKIFSL